MSDTRLDELLRSPGYTPSARDVAPLFERLADADDQNAKVIERALSRTSARAAEEARARFEAARPPLRARLCALVGRLAQGSSDAALPAWLVERLGDADPKTRRRAATALGKLGRAADETPLLDALARAEELPELRVLVTALGAVGGERALVAIGGIESEDPELGRIVREATTKLERAASRRTVSSIVLDRAPSAPVDVLLHVRAGLEDLLVDELGPGRGPKISGRGRVLLRLAEPLGALYKARTFLDVGFPLEPVPVSGGDLTSAVVTALTDARSVRIFSELTRGPIRYRLAWAEGGRRRSLHLKVAGAVSAARPDLLNDPTSAPWEVVVTERNDKSGSRIFVELWPRGVVDPRFSYRRETLFASSHPTIAAALARVAGARPDDVVWDPFAGSGMELVERALLGPYARLYGTDVDAAALERARANLAAAGVVRAELTLADARRFRVPTPPTLVVTNPPYGKRVRTATDVGELLDATLANVASQLARAGRVVWITPDAGRTDRAAARHGLKVSSRRVVDVGGVRAELQLLERVTSGEGKTARAPRSARGAPRR